MTESRPGIFAVFLVDKKTNYPMKMVFGPLNWRSCDSYRLQHMLEPVVIFELTASY